LGYLRQHLRRRHTIGQIGSTGLDVMEKAKQYNYVRKFSVDIQALQAQLENPKMLYFIPRYRNLFSPTIHFILRICLKIHRHFSL
jgi:hypothetical protein